ncbi:MAG: 4-hydroxy-3-methylbut-2-enyl diphosphate reductase [Ignavibacteriae bacterium]|nr:4-hydroxy-3-methylbut-2-enyl diphosphate reductase [Ignavibacteriota bacterium]MCB9215267.1 4-hydroxy-3-methylbut-2-enyl diphosphate reductase [Ignavibacteria bacterium]
MARRAFEVPDYYKSNIVGAVKRGRAASDPRRRDFSPALLDFGSVRFRIPRHFGFCYGVENAIEIAYRTVAEHSDKRVFLLSEMIHNPTVNADLLGMGVQFIMTTGGEQLVPWDELTSDDIVIVPAFGTTLEIQEMLEERGIDPYSFDTTCPFVQKVWNRSEKIGESGHTVVVHGKPRHEETRATFSHSSQAAPTVVVRDMEETELLIGIITGTYPIEKFEEWFGGQSSEGFDPGRDLERIGVVNQTTMLATETQAIADRLRRGMIERYGEESVDQHFADTRDTLCYATNENQTATIELIKSGGDIGIVVGGYNSSNTSHLVELCEEEMPTYFIKGPEEILSEGTIRHFDLHSHVVVETNAWLPEKRPLDILLTSGASCPDALVDEVLLQLLGMFDGAKALDEVIKPYIVSNPA